jgi:Uma2 family endonuclease
MNTTIAQLSLEEYLAREENVLVKHEYVDGQLYAMAGASKRHIRLMLNLARLLESEDCEVYASDLKVIISDSPRIAYYPDVVVVCEDETEANFTRRPCLVIEVLSESTKRIDQTEKKSNYQRLESLKAYVLVHQDEQVVELHRKLEDGTWAYEQYQAGESLALPCPETIITLEQFYEGVQ